MLFATPRARLMRGGRRAVDLIAELAAAGFLSLALVSCGDEGISVEAVEGSSDGPDDKKARLPGWRAAPTSCR